MSAASLYPVHPEAVARTFTDEATYKTMYQQSVVNPDGFWREQAQRIDWIKPFEKVKQTSFDDHHVDIKWFADGTLNVSHNCLDRHLAERGDQVAIIWEGDDPADHQEITYRQLHEQVCRFANALRGQDAPRRRSDHLHADDPRGRGRHARLHPHRRDPLGGLRRLLPRGPGRTHHRLQVEGGDHRRRRRARRQAHSAEGQCRRRPDQPGNLQRAEDHRLQAYRCGDQVEPAPRRLVRRPDEGCRQHLRTKEMGAEDPLFILYTSGSTGKAEGRAAYHRRLPGVRLADPRAGSTTVRAKSTGAPPTSAGSPATPTSSMARWPTAPPPFCSRACRTTPTTRVAKIIDKHKVNILYTAPTAIRAMMAEGKAAVAGADGSSLRLLGSVGEPINPEAWQWYYETVGQSRCPIVDTWWQTETGACLMTPLPGAHAMKPGSAAKPFFGVVPALVDNLGNLIEGAAEGNLVILDSWPGQARTLFGDHDRFVDTYFKTFKGMYFTGDGARRDEDGYYWITGRVDDVLNVPATAWAPPRWKARWSPTPKVAEAAVVGMQHDIKGQGIYVYVTPQLRGRAERGAAPGAEAMGSPRDRSDRHAGCDPVGADCRRPVRARSCGASCARSPRPSTTPRRHLHPLPTRAWSSTRSRPIARCRPPDFRLIRNDPRGASRAGSFIWRGRGGGRFEWARAGNGAAVTLR